MSDHSACSYVWKSHHLKAQQHDSGLVEFDCLENQSKHSGIDKSLKSSTKF